eukprot:1189048-Prorocentrum_minimum.AAC.5
MLPCPQTCPVYAPRKPADTQGTRVSIVISMQQHSHCYDCARTITSTVFTPFPTPIRTAAHLANRSPLERTLLLAHLAGDSGARLPLLQGQPTHGECAPHSSRCHAHGHLCLFECVIMRVTSQYESIYHIFILLSELFVFLYRKNFIPGYGYRKHNPLIGATQ